MSALVLLALALAADPPPPEPAEEEVGALIGVLGSAEAGVFGEVLVADASEGRVLGEGRVAIDYDRKRDTITVVNEHPYPVTFGLDLTQASNVRVEPPVPFDLVMAPGERLVVRFVPAEKGKMTYSYRWGWKMGPYDARHAPTELYTLPWPADLSFECTQSYNGKYSHGGEHALDIVMPKGTPILAARAGTVIEIADGWGDGAPDTSYMSKANSVRILHEDGTVASYLHLLAGGMKVSVGDAVVAGQPIAESGDSGYSRMPHLHFVVKSPLDAWVYRTWPVRFDVDGEALMLGPKKWYPPKR